MIIINSHKKEKRIKNFDYLEIYEEDNNTKVNQRVRC